MGGTYTLGADGMYYPDLSVPEEEPAHYGKYGRMHMALEASARNVSGIAAGWQADSVFE